MGWFPLFLLHCLVNHSCVLFSVKTKRRWRWRCRRAGPDKQGRPNKHTRAHAVLVTLFVVRARARVNDAAGRERAVFVYARARVCDESRD